MSVARRDGRTKIRVYVARPDTAVLVVTGTGDAGLGAAAAIGVSLGVGVAAAGPLAVVAAVAVSLGWAGIGSWATMRGVWRRIARKWVGRVDELGRELVTVAQRAIDAARKDTE